MCRRSGHAQGGQRHDDRRLARHCLHDQRARGYDCTFEPSAVIELTTQPPGMAERLKVVSEVGAAGRLTQHAEDAFWTAHGNRSGPALR